MASQRSTPRITPHGGERRPPRQGAARPLSTLWYGLAFLVVLALAQFFLMPRGRPVSYSEFKSLVRSGQVAEVVISDQTIRGMLKEPQSVDDALSIDHVSRTLAREQLPQVAPAAS